MTNGVCSFTETHRILPALVGHPWVVFADAPFVAVEFTKAIPKLIVERRPAGVVCLRLPSDSERRELAARDCQEYDIPTYGAAVERCVLIREGAARASVLQLTRAHKRDCSKCIRRSRRPCPKRRETRRFERNCRLPAAG
jgi:hypothetical protein